MADRQLPGTQTTGSIDRHVNKYGKPHIKRENKGFSQIDHEKQNQVAQSEAQNARGINIENEQLNQEHRKDPSSFNELQGGATDSRNASPDPQTNQPPNDMDAGSQ